MVIKVDKTFQNLLNRIEVLERVNASNKVKSHRHNITAINGLQIELNILQNNITSIKERLDFLEKVL